MPRREDCALSMVQRRNDAAAMDVRIKPLKEECALSMEHRSSVAATMDAQIMLSKEECVLDMGLNTQGNDAALMDAQI